MHEYVRYFFMTVIFIVIINLIAEMQKISGSTIKIICLVGIMVSMFILWKVFKTGDGTESSPKEEKPSEDSSLTKI